MTVIAYRNGILAADTLVTSNLDRSGQCLKIRKVDDPEGNTWLIGASGSLGSIQPVENWVKAGANLQKPIEYPSNMEGAGILVDPSGLAYYSDTDSVYPTPIYAPFVSIGSGSTTARTAMYLECSAIEAVETAIDLDVGCGGKATFLTIDGQEDLTLSG